jgi:hypothetical protein
MLSRRHLRSRTGARLLSRGAINGGGGPAVCLSSLSLAVYAAEDEELGNGFGAGEVGETDSVGARVVQGVVTSEGNPEG